MKTRVLFIAAFFAGLVPLMAVSYQNKALNPVTFMTAQEHEELFLIKDGKPNVIIVRPYNDGESSAMAARRSVTIAEEAVKDAFLRITGAAVKVVDAASAEAETAPVVISLGKNRISEKLGIDFKAFPKEGFIVRTFERGIAIAGDDGYLDPGRYDKFDWYRYRFNGTANGAYDFIERVLGVRYYYPGIGIYAPKVSELKISPVCYTDAPVYHNRFHYAYARHFAKGTPWEGVKNDGGIFDKAWRFSIATRFYDPIHTPVPSMLLAAHPDKKDIIFYKDKYGVVHDGPKSAILDITNLELAHLIVQDFKNFYDSDGKDNMHWRNRPDSTSLSGRQPNSEYAFFGQSDHYMGDLPDAVQHLIPPERKHSRSGALSDVYMRFYIAMANEMKQCLPGKKLGVCAYHNYRLPPVLTKPEEIPDNIDMLLCTGTIVLAKSPKSSADWQKVYGGWYKALGNRPVSAYTYGTSVPFTKALEGDYMRDFINCLEPYLSKDGGVFFDAGFNYHFYYTYYLVFRSYWNPAFDNQAAMEEHWQLLYGVEAGKSLQAFYALLKERWEKGYIGAGSADDLVGITTAKLYEAFNGKTVDRLEALLKDALDATDPGSIERLRVEFFSKPWPSAFKSARSYHSMVIPIHHVTRIEPNEKIVIDGKLDEPIWQRAAVMKMQQAHGDGSELTSRPTGRLAWDDTGIFLAFTGHGGVAVKPGDLWDESDNIEFFLSPGVNKEIYYQFAVSSGNNIHQARKVDKPVPTPLDFHWRCMGLKRAVTIAGEEWHLELFIPFEGLFECKAPQPYTVWDANLVSNKCISKGKKEYSSFSLTMGSNHNPSLWGKLRFLGYGD